MASSDCDDLKYKQLYLLEVLVKKFELNEDQQSPDEQINNQPLCVRVKFLDFPYLEITRADFLKEPANVEEEHVVSISESVDVNVTDVEIIPSKKNRSKESADELAKAASGGADQPPPDEIQPEDPSTFNIGKSCMFPMLPLELIKQIQRYPLIIKILRRNKENEFDFVGGATARLGSDFEDLIIEAGQDNTHLPVSNILESEFPVKDKFGAALGKINLFIRLSCYGVTIVNQFQLIGENGEYMFRNDKKDNTLEAQRKKSFLFGKQPFMTSSVLGKLVHQKDTLVKPLITTEDNILPIRGAEHLQEEEAYGYPMMTTPLEGVPPHIANKFRAKRDAQRNRGKESCAPFAVWPQEFDSNNVERTDCPTECGCNVNEIEQGIPQNLFEMLGEFPMEAIANEILKQARISGDNGGNGGKSTCCDSCCGARAQKTSKFNGTREGNTYESNSKMIGGPNDFRASLRGRTNQSNLPLGGNSPNFCGTKKEKVDKSNFPFSGRLSPLNLETSTNPKPEYEMIDTSVSIPNPQASKFCGNERRKSDKSNCCQNCGSVPHSCGADNLKNSTDPKLQYEITADPSRCPKSKESLLQRFICDCNAYKDKTEEDHQCFFAKMSGMQGALPITSNPDPNHPCWMNGKENSGDINALANSGAPNIPKMKDTELIKASANNVKSNQNEPQTAASTVPESKNVRKKSLEEKSQADAGNIDGKSTGLEISNVDSLKTLKSDAGSTNNPKSQYTKSEMSENSKKPKEKKKKAPKEKKIKSDSDLSKCRKKYTSIYKYTDGMYPGINIGHRHCANFSRYVPKSMGWLWNLSNSGDGLKHRRGWKPGAINKTIANMIRMNKVAAGIKVEEEERPNGPKAKTVRKARRPMTAGSGTTSTSQPRDDYDDYDQSPLPPTLHVHKKDGVYFISMNPLRLEDDDDEQVPLMFKIEADTSSSSSESSLEIECTAPGALRRRQMKPPPVCQDKQTATEDLV